MARTQIDLLGDALDFAYRGDRWSALLSNLGPVTDEEWAVKPAEHSADVFGDDPELSIGDIVLHIAGPLVMYGNRAFGDGTMTWQRVGSDLGGRDRASVMAWLEKVYGRFVDGLRGLPDDAALDELRTAHWGEQIPVRRFVAIMTNHMLYHSGEINRQLSLMRGANGWER
jgi:hypothetical protein